MDRYQIADGLHGAAIAVVRMVRSEDVRTGITPARLSALSLLVFAGPMRLNELASREQVKPPTMSKIVADMVATGLAKRRTDADDARAIIVEATKRGVAIMEQGRRQRVQKLEASLEKMTREELQILTRAPELMRRAAASGNANADT